jgi:cephalosporin hydroxylase
MEIKENITKYTDLSANDSLSAFKGHSSQQFHGVYEVFYEFIKEIKPKRILEIGTALGGFTQFLRVVCDHIGIDTKIISYDINARPWYNDMVKNNIDVRVENVFTENYVDVDDFVKNYIKEDGITLVLCDGGNKIGEFNLLSNFIKSGDFIMAHDYAYDKEYFEKNINGKVWNWLEIQESDIIQSCQKNNLKPYMEEEFSSVVWVCKIKE